MRRYFVGIDPAYGSDESVMTTGFIDDDGILTITSVQIMQERGRRYDWKSGDLVIDTTAEVIEDEPKLLGDGEEKHAF